VLPVSLRGRNRGRFSACLSLTVSISTLIVLALTAAGPVRAQNVSQTGQNLNRLPPINVGGKRPKRTAHARKPGTQVAPIAVGPTTPSAPSGDGIGATATPLNSNAVAESASRLGLPARQIPATVEIIDQKTMQQQGYRTTTEAAQGAVGVLAGDAAGAPAGFSMRGFTFGEVNVLYNGISIGPQSTTSRWMDTANLSQIEFLKGPSSLMSGLNAIGGSVNYVSRQPTSGPIRNELDLALDSLGSLRTHYGSGGSTAVQGLDYRFDVIGSRMNSFIDGDFRNLSGLSTQLNYRMTDSFKTFMAVEYKQDSGHAYWGTPVVPTSFAGSHAVSGVVSGTAVNTFDGSILGPLTVDDRTLKTNYNVADNATGANELWLRSGFEWTLDNNVTIKDQVYYYKAGRNWIDSETYAFNLDTSTIDRDRFAVSHDDQQVYGNNVDLIWDSQLLGMQNRLAARLQVSRNRITFKQNAGGFPEDTVDVVNPDPGTYGPLDFDIRNSRLDDIAGSFEDRLKLTPWFALIGGVRLDALTLARDGVNADGTIPAGQPFSQTWRPVSYRAAYTLEPIHNLTFYSMYATAYDPAAAGIFSVSPANSLALTSSRIYETGVKHLFWDDRAEWTLAAYDIARRNVYVPLTNSTFALAGEVATKGIEFAAAVRPVGGLKLWGNLALTQARYKNFDTFTGNTPSNVAPVIVNAGASYRFEHMAWPVEIGGSVRHVAARYLFEDDATTMDAYTVADAFAFVDVPKTVLPSVDQTRITFRVRNLTNKVYAAWSDPGYPDQVYLGVPRTYEVAASFKW
jgi:iron complex outermembrane receptor protein